MKLAIGIIPFLALLSGVEVLGWNEDCRCYEEITKRKKNYCKNNKAKRRRGLKGYGESGVGDVENNKYQNVVDLFYERGLSLKEMDDKQGESVVDTSNERDLISDTDSEFYDLLAEEFEADTSELEDDNEVDYADNLSGHGDVITGESRQLQSCNRLKLWHKELFSCWQFEVKDRKWCMRERGSKFIVDKCSNSRSQKVSLKREGSKYSIRVGKKCLEHTGGSKIATKSCTKSSKQLWNFVKIKNRGTEIRPAGNSKLCITQPHHPKKGETLKATNCDVPRRTFHRSAWWECY